MSSRGESQASVPEKRGQSAVLGLIVLIGLVAVVSIGMLLVAGDATTDVEQDAETERVEQSFLELSQELETASSARDAAREMALDIDGGRDAIQYRDAGEITIALGTNDSNPFTRDLGAIEYVADDGTKIVYQGGGVWRQTETGVTPISEPNVQYGDGTLNVPIPRIASDQRLESGSIRMAAGNTSRVHPGSLEEPVTITITSEYYEWWETHFEDELAVGTVTTDDSAERVTVTVEPPIDPSLGVDANFDQALTIDGTLATSSGGTTTGDVRASESVEVNSDVDGNVLSEGDVHVTTSTNQVTGDVVAEGDIQIDSDVQGDVIAGGNISVASSASTVGGNVVAGGDVTVDNGPSIGNDVYSNGSITTGWNSIGGELYATGSISAPSTPPSDEHENVSDIDGPISGTYGTGLDGLLSDRLGPDANREPLDDAINGMVSAGETGGETFRTIESGDTLEAGTHYVDQIDASSNGPHNTVTFDVQDGDINVIVRNDISLAANGQIRVANADSGNVVRFYSAGNFSMQGGTSLCPTTSNNCPNSNRDAKVLQFYGTSNSTYTFNGNSVFHGLIYAPSDDDDNVAVAGGGSLELFGSVVAGGFETNGNTELTYDDTLENRYEEPTDPTADGSSDSGSVVEYLNITVYELRVENE
ncbi:polymer-forming cytoskeletal protein [Natrinema marinum]|uniref:polymer-forming cytoskeletal protein n=1 Tax=Natrinema marinum TaxID=2961598 RepID=UPI0020C8C17C|nr:polymer-forming cytoskeletal protein [Natrinema marinum]